jgi:exodeoxyribonuclease V beta subunit
VNGARLYPFPAELDALPRDRPAVIEASAGTGKTYLIEHLVVDRLIRGDARIDEMLVVTFTERAAAELVRRIRALIQRVLGPEPTGAGPTGPHVWTIDAGAAERLTAALRALDVAPISTIHAFCQRVLTEHAFASGRLLAQDQVESRTAFAAAFDEVIRGRLEGDLASLLLAWLESGSDADSMERLLFQARRVRCEWAAIYDPERVARAARTFAALPLRDTIAAVMKAIANKTTHKAVVARVEAIHEIATSFVTHQRPPRFLADVDALVNGGSKKDAFSYMLLDDRLPAVRDRPGIAPLLAAIEVIVQDAVPLATAVAQRFGPLVEERLRARKRAAGLYDFDDMLELVAEALRAPRGQELAAALRARYQLAVIDEFQDTDPVQWQIFRAIFLDDTVPRPLYVVGDPKQSIYGFRGADVSTYEQARTEIAPLGGVHLLERNFRSTPAVIDTYNAIFDQNAKEPFFRTGIGYHNPVKYGGEDSETVDRIRPLTLLTIKADNEEQLPMRVVRARLAKSIADEIAALLGGGDVRDAREIFVLTRIRRESQTMADALAVRGIPAVLANQEGLYETDEARQVRDLLRAIADPHDPAKRLRAWLTPFFAVPLADLPAAVAGADQRLIDRLLDWHAAAESGDLAAVFGRILDESGVARRELFAGEARRRLTNFQQLFELLAVEATRTGRPVGDVGRRLAGLVAKLIVPEPEEGNALRAEGDRNAVQIMTMHRAKGLEADFVFVYGGFGPAPTDLVRSYLANGERRRLAGRPRLLSTTELMKADRDAEDQRLSYVALTRARKRLYLPYSGKVPEGEAPLFEGAKAELEWRLVGGYRHVNRRLRELVHEPDPRRLRDLHEIPIDARADDDDDRPRAAGGALAAWHPEPVHLAPVEPDPALPALRRARAGAVTTSYSRIKQAHGGYRPPTEVSDDIAAPAEGAGHDDQDGELRGGASTGIFVHALLEELPLETVRATPALDAWIARADVRAVAEPLLRRYGRDPGELLAALRLAHAALVAPLPVVGGTLSGLAHATHTAREMEFLFPFPPEAGGPDNGYVKGFVDVIFEHEGRSYFGDWKTDRLHAWDTATIAGHVEANYALQEQLYALALVRMLGITDQAAYEARFGGTLYVFVRGLGRSAGAVRGRRPTFEELTRWQDELATTLAGEAA